MAAQLLQLRLGSLVWHTYGSGPTLLFVHGFPLHHELWREQLSVLSANYRILAPDLPGFGASPCNRDCWTMRDLADLLDEGLTQLQVTQPLVWIGLSMGGYIGWEFARRHPARLRALVACDTKAAADPPCATEARLAMAEGVHQTGVAAVAETMLPRVLAPANLKDPAIYERARQLMLASSPAGVAAMQRGMAQRNDFTSWLPQLRVPVLCLGGQDDLLTPPAEMESLAKAIPGARSVTIANAGHLSPLENPTAFTEALRAFLASLL